MDISQLIQSIVLGIIQGITEWLPISSKAMMSVVMVSFYNMSLTEAVYYAIWLHIGSLFAVALFYRSNIIKLFANLPTYVRDVRHPSGYNRLTTFLIIATFATALIGAPLLVFGLRKLQLTGSYAIAFIGALLIGTGLLQLHARQRVGTRNRSLSPMDAIITGILRLAQAATTAGWPEVLVKAATACGLAVSSIASSEGWTVAGSSRNCRT